MPPGRPRGASTARNANSGRQQPTLSFNSKPTRVTKATGPDPLIRDKKKSSDLAEGRLIAEPEELEEKTITQNVREKKELEQSGKQDIVTGPNSGPNSGSDLETEVTVSANSSRSTSGASLAQESPTGEVKSLPTSSKPQSRPPPKRDELAIQAEKITDAQIKRYWKKEEDARKAPRGMIDSGKWSFFKIAFSLSFSISLAYTVKPSG